MEFVSPEGLRLDGRRPKELRQLKAELGVLQSADGSATFQMGNTKVMAAVFGPKEPEQRSQQDQTMATIRCEYAMAAFSTGAVGRGWWAGVGALAGQEPAAGGGPGHRPSPLLPTATATNPLASAS